MNYTISRRFVPTALLALLGGICVVISTAGCDVIKDNLENLDGEFLDAIAVCPEVCVKIEECEVNPPPLDTGSWGDDANIPDNSLLACSGNCVQTDRRVRFGYSDCQLECLQNEDCRTLGDCWKTRSDTYKRYCRVETKPVAPPEPMMSTDGEMMPVEVPMIENGSVTGSEEVDELVEDPAINGAIDESETLVNFGQNPPALQGLYQAQGSIDRSQNARPVGANINTQICFQGTESLSGGSVVSYCELGRPGVGRAPIIGEGNDFTVFFELDGAPVTIMFSGSLDASSNVPAAEALVTYTYGQGIWEHSVTEWSQSSTDCTCPL